MSHTAARKPQRRSARPLASQTAGVRPPPPLEAGDRLTSIENATLVLDPENTPQPDAILCSTPRKGGRVWLNEKGYLCGAPELVCEVTASSASVDLHDKFRAYRRRGIQEYLVWLTTERKVKWFQLVEEDYLQIKEQLGLIQSAIFPGLVLEVKALLKLDRARLLAGLRGAAK